MEVDELSTVVHNRSLGLSGQAFPVKGSGMRIGVVVPRFAPFLGGLDTCTARAAAALAVAGAEVTVVTRAPRRSGLSFREQLSDGYTDA